ncbi:hypothetical protein LWI28_026047 [Acer negundo]|uniref:Uncharacterized protein n=1 Tax=Acer negundo TaxID=4023 RepID=A0AAD5IHH8_ACENE|nr:hypothetical protein LWI28_026047 [Acer negundo]
MSLSDEGLTSKVNKEKKMTSMVKEEKKITFPKKKKSIALKTSKHDKNGGVGMIATRRDSEVEVVEVCSTSLVEYFNIGDLKLENRNGASLREASLDDMTLISTTERCFDHSSSSSGNSCVNLADNQEFIDSLQKSLKEKENDILRLEKDNLQLHAKMTHLNDEVRCVKGIEGKLKMELEEARSSFAKMTSSLDINDSLKVDIVAMSKYEKEIEDCHQRIKAMKDELA